MRAALGLWPIRWQITVLHATILTLVLLGCGLLLYTQQRAFLFESAATRLRAQARPLIDSALGSPPEPAPRPRDSAPPLPVLDQPLRQTLAGLADDLASRDTAAEVLELDGALIARGRLGPPIPASDARAIERAARGLLGERFIATAAGPAGDDRMLVVLIPLWRDGQVVALAQLSTPAAPIDDVMRRLAIYLALGLGLAVALATLLGVSATRRVLRPLDRMVATTRAIAGGDLSQRVGLPPEHTEIAQLGGAFDAMVARLEGTFAAQRRFVADAAHELRTPLAALSGSVELLRIGAADDPAKAERLLRHLDTELNRVIRLTNDLLTLSTLDAQPRIERRPLDISALLSEVAEQSRTLIQQHSLDVEVAPDLWVDGDADRLRQVILNLLDNARKYTPPGGRISLRATADGQDVCVLVRDTGSGIPAEALPQLFERFYRVDSARTRQSGGSGLGLAIVQAIMQAHGGMVTVESALGAGTSVWLRLPGCEPLANLQIAADGALPTPATLDTSK